MQTNEFILLIEDNLIDQLITTKLLKKKFENFQYHVVNDGKEGIDWLNANYNSIEHLIILLDIKMPGMDGFEFLKNYDALSEELKNKTEIYMLSSTLDPNDLKKANENTYVKKLFNKPLCIEQFVEIIMK